MDPTSYSTIGTPVFHQRLESPPIECNKIMIKHWLLQILEHGTVPAVALALAVAVTNSGSRPRQDLTDPKKRGTGILFSAPTIDTMTSSAKDHEFNCSLSQGWIRERSRSHRNNPKDFRCSPSTPIDSSHTKSITVVAGSDYNAFESESAILGQHCEKCSLLFIL
jgi:hypothetical protein